MSNFIYRDFVLFGIDLNQSMITFYLIGYFSVDVFQLYF